ncbi:hypothetical protein ALC57_06094 [Trachymyrmex cornetzi]|uniref:Uncharacterized protein n=1 Tax=Trachymyrmex cornetzi TaxID=471704 RepID=A0A195E8P1_9HYME|nr:hypothetical protein ALC57_06094 [Trachymyrmex cornetzi]
MISSRKQRNAHYAADERAPVIGDEPRNGVKSHGEEGCHALAFLPRLSFASHIIYSEYFVRNNSDMSSESLYSLRLSVVWDGEQRGGRFKAAQGYSSYLHKRRQQNDTNLNKCKTSSLPDGAVRRRLVRNNFLCWNECYETTSDEGRREEADQISQPLNPASVSEHDLLPYEVYNPILSYSFIFRQLRILSGQTNQVSTSA